MIIRGSVDNLGRACVRIEAPTELLADCKLRIDFPSRLVEIER